MLCQSKSKKIENGMLGWVISILLYCNGKQLSAAFWQPGWEGNWYMLLNGYILNGEVDVCGCCLVACVCVCCC